MYYATGWFLVCVFYHDAAFRLLKLYSLFSCLDGCKRITSLMASTMDSYSLRGHYVIPYTLYLVLHNDCLTPVRHVYPTHVNLIKHDLSYTSFSPCWWQAHLFRSFVHTYLLCCPMDLTLTGYFSLVLIYISTFLPAVLLVHQNKKLYM
jgi:hypothetical protein